MTLVLMTLTISRQQNDNKGGGK